MKCEPEGGAQALDLWTGCSGEEKPSGPSAPALPACLLLESPSSSCPNSLSLCPSEARDTQKVGSSGYRDQQRSREGKGLVRGHSASWSEAELASGHRPQLPRVLTMAPAPFPRARLTCPLLLLGLQ